MGRPETRRTTLLHLLILAAVVAAVYSNTLHNEYHLDDFGRIAENPEIGKVFPIGRHFLNPATSSSLATTVQYRPLLPLSLSVNHAAGEALGLEPLTAFHLGNVAVHLLAVLALYLLLHEILAHWNSLPPRLAGRARTLALLASLLFAVHPVSGVPVNYLAARDLLLMQLFLLTSILVYVRMRRLGASPGQWALVLALLSLSILSKTNAAVAPVLVLAFELFLARESPLRPRLWLRVLPFALVVASFFAWTELVLDFSDVGQLAVARSSVLEYPLTQLKLHLTHYLRNFVWPFTMRPLPLVEPVRGLADPLSWLGAAVVAGSLLAVWAFRLRMAALSFSILAYWILLAPTSSVLPFRMLAADYRQYPSLPFLCLIAVLALALLVRRWQYPLAAAALLYFGVSTVWMNGLWATEESLWGHTVRHGATSIAHLNYARSQMGKDDRLAEYHLQESLRLNPGNAFTHINLGLLYIRTGRQEEGLRLSRRAVELAPNWGLTHYWLSRAYSQLGRTAEAAAESARASDLDPLNLSYAYQAAWDAQLVGDFASSLAYLERVHRLGEGYEKSLFLRGYAHQRLGSNPEAIADYRRYLEQRPDDSQGVFNLAYALMETGEYAAAVEQFQRTLQLRPSYHEVHRHLARCFEALGQEELAARHRAEYSARTEGPG